MRRFFVQNIFFLVLVNLVVKPLWIFGIDRNVQLAVGHEIYGSYVALLNFSMIFQVLLDFGLQNYNSRILTQTPQAMRRLFPNILIAKSLLSLGYLLLLCLLGLLLGYSGRPLGLLLSLGLVQVLTSFLLYLRSNVSALQHFRTDSLLSVSDRLFLILICSALLFYPALASGFRIEWFVYAQIAAYLLAVFIATVICIRLTPLDWKHYDLKRVWRICRKSFPYALLIFLMAIYIRADVFLMERLLPDGSYEAGVYAAAYRFLDVANNITGVLFAGILLPMFGRLLARREPVQPLVRLSVNLLLPVAFTTIAFAAFFGKEIMYRQLRDMASAYDGRVFSLLMIAYPGYCIGYVYSTLLTAHGSIPALIRNNLGAVVLNLGLNLVLMPRYGALGAAFTCCVTQGYLALVNIYTAQKRVGLRTDLVWVLRYLVFGGVILLLCIGARWLGGSLWLRLGLVGTGAGAAMLGCGFLPFRKIRELWANKV